MLGCFLVRTNRFNAALVSRWIFSLLLHLLNIIIWVIYEATKPNSHMHENDDDDSNITQNHTTKDDEEPEIKDRNHLWV